MIKKFWYDESGATLIEYALVVLFVVVLCVMALTSIGTSVEQKIDGVNQGLT